MGGGEGFGEEGEASSESFSLPSIPLFIIPQSHPHTPGRSMMNSVICFGLSLAVPSMRMGAPEIKVDGLFDIHRAKIFEEVPITHQS